MLFEVTLKNEHSCLGCPLLGVRGWNEEWSCQAEMGDVPYLVDRVFRLRPKKCIEFFENQNRCKIEYK